MSKRAVKLSVTRKDSDLERAFDTLLRQLAPEIPEPQKNYRFNFPLNKMELDRAWVDWRAGVELDGGTWSKTKSGHNSGMGIRNRCLKGNFAVLSGWRVLWFTSDLLRDKPDYCIEAVRSLLELPFA